MRILFRFILALFALGIAAFLVIILMPADRVAAVAAARFEAATGRTLIITGDLRPSLWPVMGVRVEGVEVGNAPWAADTPLLRAERLEVGIEPAALLSGRVEIRDLVLVEPRLLLERARDGRVNWQLESADTPSAARSTPAPETSRTPTALPRITLQDGEITYIDHGTGEKQTVSALDLELERGAETVNLRGSALHQGQPAIFEARIGDPDAALTGAVAPLSLQARYGAASVTFNGRAGYAPLAAEGRTELRAENARALVPLLGASLPVDGASMIAGDLSYTPEGSLHLRNGDLRLGGTQMRLSADMRPGPERPRITARINADDLRLPQAAGPSAGGTSGGTSGATTPAATGWSTDPLDFSALHLVDAEIALAANRIEAAGLQLGPTDILMRLDAGRAVFDLRDLRPFDGRVSGEFVINARGGLSVGGNLRADDIGMQPLLRWLAGQDRLIADASGQVRFLGSGNSVAAIMRSLSGEGRISLGQGAIQGLDLVGMLRRLDASYVGEGAQTIFDGISGSFTMQGGIMRNDDLLFSAPLLRATGQGQVDLGARTLDYRLLPTALTGADGSGGLRVPVIVTGPWADPSVRLDLQGILEEQIDRRALEQQAEAEARRALERLGVEQQEGERLEDAARRRLEEEGREIIERELGRGLERLLGRN
ncbi:AsmA family protein [Halodurantibacterium flavum]|uniref:AsmA family protein n=1 Tax=Halodurantibacterium flavum TaxID=1382802 RepID=A0ABW4S7M1_9RHOB